MTSHIFGLICAAAVLVFMLWRPLLDWRRERAERARRRQAAQAWSAVNPPGPPLTSEEVRAFEDWVTAETLPAIVLSATDTEVDLDPFGSRLGGPAWFPEDVEWPLDRSGRPMEFLAQINFGGLPPIPDFPDTGLLQFFIAQSDFFGADFDEPDRCDIQVSWHPEPRAGHCAQSPPLDARTSITPLDHALRDYGVPLIGTVAAMSPTSHWRIDEKLVQYQGLDELCDELSERGRAFEGVHHVGGHPVYTQWDYRSADRFADYDRTLLRLTSDNGLLWGDCGEAAFTIRREDLLARRFDRVIFWWDCT